MVDTRDERNQATGATEPYGFCRMAGGGWWTAQLRQYVSYYACWSNHISLYIWCGIANRLLFALRGAYLFDLCTVYTHIADRRKWAGRRHAGLHARVGVGRAHSARALECRMAHRVNTGRR